MTNLLVISRFNEDISWIKNINIPYVLYNKNSENIPILDNTILVPNIDTESYVYLRYIVDNYYSLPDRIIFSQANPFDHTADFLNLLLYTNQYSDTQPLTSYYSIKKPIKTIRNITFPYLNINNIPIHIEFYDNNFNTLISKHKFIQTHTQDVYRRLFAFFQRKNIRNEIMNFIGIQPRKFNNLDVSPFCYSAIFSVTKEKIMNYSYEFYTNLYNKCVTIHKKNTIDRRLFGWIMEYGWMELFQYDPPKDLFPQTL